MNESDVTRFQDLMQGLVDLIDRKDCEIAEQFEKGFQKGKNKGYEDGSEKAWALAKRIVHLKWDGALVATCNTVEDWFDMCFEDAAEAMAKHDLCQGAQTGIVRCRDCRYRDNIWTQKANGMTVVGCLRHGETHDSDWFCADGEKGGEQE